MADDMENAPSALPPLEAPVRDTEKDLALHLILNYLGSTVAGVARVMIMHGPMTLRRLRNECVRMRGPEFDALLPASEIAELAPITERDVTEAVLALRRHGLLYVTTMSERLARECQWGDALVSMHGKQVKNKKAKAKRKDMPLKKKKEVAVVEEVALDAVTALRLAFLPLVRLTVAQDLGHVEASVLCEVIQRGNVAWADVVAAPVARVVDPNDDSEQPSHLSAEEKRQGLARLLTRGALALENELGHPPLPHAEAMAAAHRALGLPWPQDFVCERLPVADMVNKVLDPKGKGEAWLTAEVQKHSFQGRFKAAAPNAAKLGEPRSLRRHVQPPILEDLCGSKKRVRLCHAWFARAQLLDSVARYVGLCVGDALAYEIARALLAMGCDISDERVPKISRAVSGAQVINWLRTELGDGELPPATGPIIIECLAKLVDVHMIYGIVVGEPDPDHSQVYAVNVELALAQLRDVQCMAILHSTLGVRAARVYGALKNYGALEEHDLCSKVLDAPDQTRAALYRLQSLGLVHMQEVPRRNEFHPASMHVLWSVSVPETLLHDSRSVHKAFLNYFIRLQNWEEVHAQLRADVDRAAVMKPGEKLVPGPKYDEYLDLQAKLFRTQMSLWDPLFILSDLARWTEQNFGGLDVALQAPSRTYLKGHASMLLPLAPGV